MLLYMLPSHNSAHIFSTMCNCTAHKYESVGALYYSFMSVCAHVCESMCAGVYIHLHSLDSVLDLV